MWDSITETGYRQDRLGCLNSADVYDRQGKAARGLYTRRPRTIIPIADRHRGTLYVHVTLYVPVHCALATPTPAATMPVAVMSAPAQVVSNPMINLTDTRPRSSVCRTALVPIELPSLSSNATAGCPLVADASAKTSMSTPVTGSPLASVTPKVRVKMGGAPPGETEIVASPGPDTVEPTGAVSSPHAESNIPSEKHIVASTVTDLLVVTANLLCVHCACDE